MGWFDNNSLKSCCFASVIVLSFCHLKGIPYQLLHSFAQVFIVRRFVLAKLVHFFRVSSVE